MTDTKTYIVYDNCKCSQLHESIGGDRCGLIQSSCKMSPRLATFRDMPKNKMFHWLEKVMKSS